MTITDFGSHHLLEPLSRRRFALGRSLSGNKMEEYAALYLDKSQSTYLSGKFGLWVDM